MRFLGMLRHGEIWPVLSSNASSSPARRRISTTTRPPMAPCDSGRSRREEAIEALASVADMKPTKGGSSGSP